MSTPSTGTKPAPQPTPETQHYWDAAASGTLRVQRCRLCTEHYFYPRAYCPNCGGADVAWIDCSGRASLYSYVISHRPAPGFDPPYVIGVVQLAEGPRMVSNIVSITPDPAQLELDMPLRVAFEQRGEVMVPVFEPAEEAIQ